MAGTPSSRGCEACRKQKKKCDALKPACSRCTRLKIPCVGAGQRRFMFKVQTGANKPKKVSTSSKRHCQKRGTFSAIGQPSSPLSNDATLAVGAFVSILEVNDPRYDVTGYSVFLKDIPRRIGTSNVLDASSRAFASVFSAVQSKQSQSIKSLSQFADALHVLRGTLKDDTYQTVDTLCVIYLILLCQGWISQPSDQYVNHIQGIAHLLNRVTDKDWQGTFESQTLATVCMAVIFESITTPGIKLSPWLVNLKKIYYGPEKPWGIDDHKGIGTQTITIEHMVKIPDYFQEPEFHLYDLRSSYQTAIGESKNLCAYVAAMALSVTPYTDTLSLRMYIRIQGVASVLVSTGLLLNTILRTLEPNNELLIVESRYLISEIMKIATRASSHRPLGAIHIPLWLSIAWATTDDAGTSAEVECMIKDYEADIPQANWFDIAIWLKAKFESLKQRRERVQIGMLHEPLLVESRSSSVPCCVM